MCDVSSAPVLHGKSALKKSVISSSICHAVTTLTFWVACMSNHFQLWQLWSWHSLSTTDCLSSCRWKLRTSETSNLRMRRGLRKRAIDEALMRTQPIQIAMHHEGIHLAFAALIGVLARFKQAPRKSLDHTPPVFTSFWFRCLRQVRTRVWRQKVLLAIVYLPLLIIPSRVIQSADSWLFILNDIDEWCVLQTVVARCLLRLLRECLGS